jgi:hypothetical protein
LAAAGGGFGATGAAAGGGVGAGAVAGARGFFFFGWASAPTVISETAEASRQKRATQLRIIFLAFSEKPWGRVDTSALYDKPGTSLRSISSIPIRVAEDHVLSTTSPSFGVGDARGWHATKASYK